MKQQPKSKKPRKQRNWLKTAPVHRRQKMVGSTLSKELRQKYGKRAIPVRKGDSVKIMRGEFSGVTAEVTEVSLKEYLIYIDGVTVKKADGTDKPRPVSPSNVMLTELNLEDKERREMLERKAK